MSIPAQGAVGAVKTVSAITLTFDQGELFDAVAKVGDGGETLGRRIVGVMLTGGRSNFREDVGLAYYGVTVAPPLASPRADSDERTAGRSAVAQALRAAEWGGVSIGNKALIAAAISELEATPAQPAGAVPDSLRAHPMLSVTIQALETTARNEARTARCIVHRDEAAALLTVLGPDRRVPDSLRKALEGATQGDAWAVGDDEKGLCVVRNGNLEEIGEALPWDARFLMAAAEWVRTLIAAEAVQAGDR